MSNYEKIQKLQKEIDKLKKLDKNDQALLEKCAHSKEVKELLTSYLKPPYSYVPITDDIEYRGPLYLDPINEFFRLPETEDLTKYLIFSKNIGINTQKFIKQLIRFEIDECYIATLIRKDSKRELDLQCREFWTKIKTLADKHSIEDYIGLGEYICETYGII